MSEFTIPETIIASSDPPSVCAGLSLFPPFPDIGAGIHTGADAVALIDKNWQLLAARASAALSFGFFMGICGPGYGIKTNMEGNVKDKVLTLTYRDDEFVGGFAMGLTGRLGIELKAEVYKITWHSAGWQAEIDVSGDIEFDLIKFIFDIIAALLQGGDFTGFVEKTEPISEAFKTSLSILDGETGSWQNYQNGEVRIDPTFDVPINLWPVLVALSQLLDETGVGEVVLAIDEVLNCTLSSLGFGPMIGVGIPLTLKISKVALDDTAFDNPETVLVDSDNEHYGWSGTADGTPAADPQRMTVTFKHNAGFSLHFGVFASIQLIEFFQAGASFDFSIIQILDIAPQPQPFEHTLSNRIGQTGSANSAQNRMNGFEMMDVEFV